MNRKIAIAVSTVVSTVLMGGAAQARDNPGNGVSLELYALTTDVSIQLSSPPQPGETAIFGRDLYWLGGTVNEPEPAGDPIGRNTILCTMITTSEASCEGRWSLDDIGQITGSAYLDFTQADTDGSGASLTGGSGAFMGAEGVINTYPAAGGQDQVWIVDITGFSQP